MKVGNVVDGKYVGQLTENEVTHNHYKKNTKNHEVGYDDNFSHL